MTQDATISIKTIHIAEITPDPDMQARDSIDQETVEQYADDMEAGATFPEMVVFHDGKSYWLADGWHRWHAYNRIDQEDVKVEVHSGTRRDAILYAIGANTDHGLRRTNDDKRRAVSLLLEDKEWGKWSNIAIARQCAVSDHFVGKLRKVHTPIGSEYETPPTSQERTFTHPKTGQPTQMDTANIGGNGEEPSGDTAPDDLPVDELGRAITDPAVAAIFDHAADLVEFQATIQRMRKTLEAYCLTPLGAYITHQQVDRDLKNVWSAIKFAIPYAVCPKHKDIGCKNCSGIGFLPKKHYERLPEEIRDRF